MHEEFDSIFPRDLQKLAAKRAEEIMLGELGVRGSALPEGISACTAAKVIGAKQRESYITAGQHRETLKFHGILWVDHPTPSGASRWKIAVSDHRGYDTKEVAVERFIGLWPEELGRFRVCIGSRER